MDRGWWRSEDTPPKLDIHSTFRWNNVPPAKVTSSLLSRDHFHNVRWEISSRNEGVGYMVWKAILKTCLKAKTVYSMRTCQSMNSVIVSSPSQNNAKDSWNWWCYFQKESIACYTKNWNCSGRYDFNSNR